MKKTIICQSLKGENGCYVKTGDSTFKVNCNEFTGEKTTYIVKNANSKHDAMRYVEYFNSGEIKVNSVSDI